MRYQVNNFDGDAGHSLRELLRNVKTTSRSTRHTKQRELKRSQAFWKLQARSKRRYRDDVSHVDSDRTAGGEKVTIRFNLHELFTTDKRRSGPIRNHVCATILILSSPRFKYSRIQIVSDFLRPIASTVSEISELRKIRKFQKKTSSCTFTCEQYLFSKTKFHQ